MSRVEYTSLLGNVIPRIFPALESIHILGVGCLAGAITLANLARLGYRGIPEVSRWVTVGAWLALVSGPLMFSLNSTRYVQNEAFCLKILFLAAAFPKFASCFTLGR